jgi:cytoskeletal protein RodZ
MDEPLQPTKPAGEDDDERDRRVTNIFLLVFFVVIVGSGIWLVNAMIEQRQIDDCVAQGRRNCAPIDTSGR